MNLVSLCVPMVHPCIKNAPTMHWPTYYLVWIIDTFFIHSSPHPRARARPFTPEMLWTRECIPTPFSFIIFTFKLAFESYEEFGDASKVMCWYFALCLFMSWCSYISVFFCILLCLVGIPSFNSCMWRCWWEFFV